LKNKEGNTKSEEGVEPVRARRGGSEWEKAREKVRKKLGRKTKAGDATWVIILFVRSMMDRIGPVFPAFVNEGRQLPYHPA
jgi:hypothetical protein